MGKRDQWGTRAAFLGAGILVSAWAPLVPLAKDRLAVDEGQLGALLLCLGLGSVLGMPFAGGLAGRFGCRKVILTAAIVACAALVILSFGSTTPLMAAALLAFGAGIGTMDVVMNIQAVIVEKASGRAMMSGFHGLYSVGGIVGAGCVLGMISLGATPFAAVSIIAASIATMLLALRKGLLTYGSEEESAWIAIPRGQVLLIGILCFILFLAEGSVLDWSAVFLASVRQADTAQAGLGYVAFSITMTLGRLTGDAIVQALGPKKVLLLGGLSAALGFVVACFAPSWPASVAGFALVGVGASNVVPVLFSAAARQRSMPPHLALAAVTTMGYAGILVGPAAIGFLADATNLPAALTLVAVLLFAAGLSAGWVTRDS